MKRIVSITMLFLAGLIASAQQLPQFPIDKAVRTGKLDNGMTYYIRHNDKPAQRAEFYLVTHVGAVQEMPDQDGLAHFLEHMCFNGTKNFPGKSLLNYLEGIGASFGGNINAATGFESTQYMLNNIPLTREGIIDTCLLIMHDYSHFVSCDPVEIDNERGVILEEKRSRNNAGWRNYLNAAQYYFKGSKLANTSLIGSEENLKTFKPESLTNFYHTWYRPDLQAIIVVGDIDELAVEKKIKDIFSDIPAAENPKAKEPVVPEKNAEPIIGIITDPETNSSSIEMLWKSETLPVEYNNTIVGLSSELLKTLFTSAMNERLQDLAAKPEAKFTNAWFSIGNICESTEAVMAQATMKDGAALDALAELYTEIERIKRYGFTEAEYERAKAELKTTVENAAEKASTRKNAEFINGIISHFTNNELLLDPKDYSELVKQVLPNLKTADLNKALAQIITEENLVVLYVAPEKEGIKHPQEAEILKVIEDVRSSQIAAPEQEEIAKDFLDATKLKGSKVKAIKAGLHGSTVMSLKNGANIILMPTEHEKNKVSVKLMLNGGQTLIPTEDLASFEDNIWGLYLSNTGVAEFPATQVAKMLAGKSVSCNPYIDRLHHGISLQSTPKDLETALQLLYLQFTAPRFDANEYAQGTKMIEQVLPNLLTNSSYKFQQELYGTLYGNNPRKLMLNEEILAKANLATIERNYRKLFSGVDGANVFVVGDFDTETVKALLNKYIGSLPKGKATQWTDDNVSIVNGELKNTFKAKMEAPMVTVFQCYKSEVPYSMEKSVTYSALSYILDMIYTATLREEEGGTYGASSSASVARVPKPYGILQVYFQTNEAQAEKLSELAKKGLKKLADEGPDAEQFDKTVKNLLKGIPEKRIKNSYWMEVLETWALFNSDRDSEYEAAVNALTPEKIKEAAAELYNSGNFIEIMMYPEEKAQ